MVLPSVLVFIAAFSAMFIVLIEQVDRARDLAVALSNRHEAESALDAAEAHVLYLWGTGRGVSGGVELLPTASGLSIAEALLGTSDPDGEAAQILGPVWRANGHSVWFQSDSVSVEVTYWDSTSMISLRNTDATILALLLEQFGVPSSRASGMVAALMDYQDRDAVRRFQGAERADYRQAGIPSPADAPIRSLKELGYVLGWKDFKAREQLGFLQLVTVNGGESLPRRSLAHSSLVSILDRYESSITRRLITDPMEEALGSGDFPRSTARFVLRAIHERSGKAYIRIIELKRNTASIISPFERHLVWTNVEPHNEQGQYQLNDGFVFPLYEVQGR